MKEFLVNHDNRWTLQLLDVDTEENSFRVAVPSGAELLSTCGDNETLIFWKDGFNQAVGVDSDWDSDVCSYYKFKNIYPLSEILWQRHTHPEELSFIDDEPKSLNDTYVEIELVRQTLNERQSTYGDFTSVANTTRQLMAVILNSKNGQTLPYAHEEALHMICSKIARIMNGDINHKDSWHDIQGYAKLIEDLL